MHKQTPRLPPALKHGCYSGMDLLPTEDRIAFDKLHRDLVAEFQPTGVSEEILVLRLAKFTWRRENLTTYGLADYARSRYSSIFSILNPPNNWEMMPILGAIETRSAEELKALREEAEEQAKRELGAAYELVNIGSVASTEHLEKEMLLIERLDGMIARCLKQLLLIRGAKSMALSTPAETKPRLKRIA
jgi:hypothetical protein